MLLSIVYRASPWRLRPGTPLCRMGAPSGLKCPI
jgi:hypothetical protein